jgi:hypothetical protein
MTEKMFKEMGMPFFDQEQEQENLQQLAEFLEKVRDFLMLRSTKESLEDVEVDIKNSTIVSRGRHDDPYASLLAENGLTGNSPQWDILNVIMGKQNWYDFILPAIGNGLSWDFAANNQIFLERARGQGIDISQMFREASTGVKLDHKSKEIDEKIGYL